MILDLPLSELRTYQAPTTAPADFDDFWRRTLAETRQHPLDARFEPRDHPAYQLVDVYDTTFNGWGGHPIKAWLVTPAGNRQRRPCVVSYVGYGGGRSLPIDHLAPAVAGFAHLVMDTRGQGAAWSPGDTSDPVGSGPQFPGFMTRGIEAPDTYYYRRVFTDAVRAVEAAQAHSDIDPSRLALAGCSQGGGMAIAVAGLIPAQVRVLIADVPFLCHFRRALELTDRPPYAELTSYLRCHPARVDQVLSTLAYFDAVHFAQRVRARTLFSVGLLDPTCPPSTVFAAYNRIPADKDISVYEYNEHEGGGPFHVERRLQFLAEHLVGA